MSTFRSRVDDVITLLNTRLEELADGCIDLVELDEDRRVVTVKVLGGRLI